MKAQLVLFAGTLTGLSLLASPALSQQDNPTHTPGTRQTPPTRTTGASDNFQQAAKMLEGQWQISAKFLGAGSSATGGSSQTGNEIKGTSNREWILNNKILTEEVKLNGESSSITGGASGNFNGHGMFGYDRNTNQFQHVWTDSTDSKISYSVGRYDERTRTFTFNKQDATNMPMPGRGVDPMPSRPGADPMNPPSRPNSPNFNDQVTPPTNPPGTNPPGVNPPGTNPPGTINPPPATPPSSRPQTRPGVGDQPDKHGNLENVQRVVIRILDDNRHTVEYFTDASGTQKVMEITYTKNR